eukprot:2523200-Pyramimonas_sp.AAC.1
MRTQCVIGDADSAHRHLRINPEYIQPQFWGHQAPRSRRASFGYGPARRGRRRRPAVFCAIRIMIRTPAAATSEGIQKRRRGRQ